MTERRRSARALPEGYVYGPAAATEATTRALERLDDPLVVVLVEGISDQVAIETVAATIGRDLAGERVAVVPVGGAQGVGRFLDRFGPAGSGIQLAGLCDAGEERVWWQALARSGVGTPMSRRDMAALGFHVCVDDLEDELIRAVDTDRVQAILDEQGDLRPFRTLQKQAEWRGQSVHDQLRRFVAAGARRKLRYAWLLAETAVELGRVPGPLTGVLAAVASAR